MTTRRRVAADTPLRECPERSVGLALPFPLSDGLDGLVALVVDSGGSTSRKELIAALILAAPIDGEVLMELVANLRRAKAHEGLLVSDRVSSFLTFCDQTPGPRPRRRSGRP